MKSLKYRVKYSTIVVQISKWVVENYKAHSFTNEIVCKTKNFDTLMNFVLKVLFYFSLNFNSIKNPLEEKKTT